MSGRCLFLFYISAVSIGGGEGRPPPQDPQPSAPPNSRNSAAAMHDGGNLGDASPPTCVGGCLRSRTRARGRGPAVHGECDATCRVDGSADRLTVGGQQEVGRVLLRKPSDFVDLLLNLQTLQVVELRFVALECAVNIVLSPALRLALAL